MALFKKKEANPVRPVAVALAAPPAMKEPDLRDKIPQLSHAIDTFVSGDLRDTQIILTIVDSLGARYAPHHFPNESIWARSIPFSDRAAAIEEWLIVVKLYQLLIYWNDDAGPQIRQINPQLVDILGWARNNDRITLREKAFEAAQKLKPFQVVFPGSGDTVGSILLLESNRMGRAVDWLANPGPPPPPPPSIRERIDAIIVRARQGDADAIAYEKALSAQTEEEMRRFLDEAASLGSVEAMEAAAEMAQSAGDLQSEAFWAETAANAGSVKDMNRLVAILYGSGRAHEAIGWLEKAGQAGDSTAYPLLAHMSNESGDHVRAQHWTDVGSTSGNAECMRMKASNMLNSGGAENTVLAHAWFVESARHGSDQAMFQLGELAEHLGNQPQASYWFHHAASLGNADAQQRLGQGA